MSARSFRRERAREIRREQRRRQRRAHNALATGALIGVTALAGPAAANAATFTVDNTTDATAASACDPGVADDCSLRQAVANANGNGTGSDIVNFSVLSGTIRLTNGQINVTGDIDIQGPVGSTLTISGDADNDGNHDVAMVGDPNHTRAGDSRIFQFGTVSGFPPLPTGVTASVSHLTLSGGTSPINSKYVPAIGGTPAHEKYTADPGGAVVAYGSTVSLSHVTMADNLSAGAGGALEATSGSLTTPVTIADSEVSGNEAYASGGGVVTTGGPLTVTDSEISGNTTHGSQTVAGTQLKYDSPGNGGGIYASGPSATISGSTFSDNTAADQLPSGGGENDAKGGGLYLAGNGTSAFGVTDTTISGNSGVLKGGGAYIRGGEAAISGSTISDNTLTNGLSARAWGGGLYVSGGLGVSGSTISGNSVSATPAPQGIGGGLYWSADARDQGLDVESSTISGNQSSGGGAGAYIYAYSDYDATAMASFGTGPVAFKNSTIAGNTSSPAVPSGGGLWEKGYTQTNATDPAAVSLSSTIVGGNAPSDLGASGTSTGFDAGHSLVQSDVSGIPFTQSPAGSNVLGVSPQLGPLHDNGGPTETMLPQNASPAIDAGVANGLTTDQRGTGFDRTKAQPNVPDHDGSDGTDIGAVEVQSEIPLPPPSGGGGPTPTTPAPTPPAKKCKRKKHGKKSASAAKKQCKKTKTK